MNKKLYIIIAIIIAVVSLWWWRSKQVGTEISSDTADINRDLNNLNVNNLDKEFKQVDQNLNQL